LPYYPNRAASICAVAAFTGLRRADLRGLRWEDHVSGTDLEILVSAAGFEPATHALKVQQPKSTGDEKE
jgi:hypothetical protein